VFSIVYHDVVYNVLKKDNEEKSAAYAEKKLSALHFPQSETTHCKACILATKSHHLNDDNELNLFIDADLSILGSEQEVYVNYARQIRKEYSIYPDFMYRPGRQKVLSHFLQMKRIFKTDEFFNKYEAQARINLQHERALLTDELI
jgi:predicted metal-dependent HD superfamily phosphohydrolase